MPDEILHTETGSPFSFVKIRKSVLLIVKIRRGLIFTAVNRRCQYGSAENH